MTKWMLLCAATIAISGCATTRQEVPDVSCSSFSVIRPSRADTPETKRQVLIHNQTWRAMCEAKSR